MTLDPVKWWTDAEEERALAAGWRYVDDYWAAGSGAWLRGISTPGGHRAYLLMCSSLYAWCGGPDPDGRPSLVPNWRGEPGALDRLLDLCGEPHLQLNAGGTPHSPEEIARVRALLRPRE